MPALELAGIKDVPFIVSGEQVSKGKPDPEPYLAGLKREFHPIFDSRYRRRLTLLIRRFAGLESLSSSNDSIDPSTVLVIEDAPAGFVSGRAAGCQLLAVCTGPTSNEEVQRAANANGVRVIRDLRE